MIRTCFYFNVINFDNPDFIKLNILNICYIYLNLCSLYPKTYANPRLIWKKTSHFSKKITTPSTLSEVVLLFKSLFHSVPKYVLKFDGNWYRD